MALELVAHCEKRYATGAVVRVDLELPGAEGSVAVLFGPSGSGKTTALRVVAGLERPAEGFVRFGRETWSDAEARVWVPTRERSIGYVAQDYALFPHLTVAQNIAYGLFALDRIEREKRTGQLLSQFALESLATRRPREISGGQRQRAALARALARRPGLLLLDEPFSALDVPTREVQRAELRRILRETGVPTVLVTHDRTEAMALGDTLVVLSEGRVRQVGAVWEVFSQPADHDVARIVGVETVVPGRVTQTEDGLVTVAVGNAELLAVDSGGIQGAVFVCVRAEDVTVAREPGGASSARNRLAARVLSVSPEGPVTRVVLDCGFRLVALLTRQSCAELGIDEGVAVTASVKAPSVRLVRRDGTR